MFTGISFTVTLTGSITALTLLDFSADMQVYNLRSNEILLI